MSESLVSNTVEIWQRGQEQKSSRLYLAWPCFVGHEPLLVATTSACQVDVSQVPDTEQASSLPGCTRTLRSIHFC